MCTENSKPIEHVAYTCADSLRDATDKFEKLSRAYLSRTRAIREVQAILREKAEKEALTPSDFQIIEMLTIGMREGWASPRG